MFQTQFFEDVKRNRWKLVWWYIWLTQHVPNILISTWDRYKVVLRYFTFFSCIKPLKLGVCFTLEWAMFQVFKSHVWLGATGLDSAALAYTWWEAGGFENWVWMIFERQKDGFLTLLSSGRRETLNVSPYCDSVLWLLLSRAGFYKWAQAFIPFFACPTIFNKCSWKGI